MVGREMLDHFDAHAGVDGPSDRKSSRYGSLGPECAGLAAAGRARRHALSRRGWEPVGRSRRAGIRAAADVEGAPHRSARHAKGLHHPSRRSGRTTVQRRGSPPLPIGIAVVRPPASTVARKSGCANKAIDVPAAKVRDVSTSRRRLASFRKSGTECQGSAGQDPRAYLKRARWRIPPAAATGSRGNGAALSPPVGCGEGASPLRRAACLRNRRRFERLRRRASAAMTLSSPPLRYGLSSSVAGKSGKSADEKRHQREGSSAEEAPLAILS